MRVLPCRAGSRSVLRGFHSSAGRPVQCVTRPARPRRLRCDHGGNDAPSFRPKCGPSKSDQWSSRCSANWRLRSLWRPFFSLPHNWRHTTHRLAHKRRRSEEVFRVLRVYGGIGAIRSGPTIAHRMFRKCCQNITNHGCTACVASGQHWAERTKKPGQAGLSRCPRTRLELAGGAERQGIAPFGW